MENSVDPDQLKPADQDIHCFSHKDISWVSRTRVFFGNKVMLMQHHVKSVTVWFSFYIEKKLLHVFLWFISCNNVNRVS